MACESVGEARPDIAGIGVLVGFAGQASLSLILATWVFFLSAVGFLDVKHKEGSREHLIERKRLDIITEILMVGNDIQMLTGISYIIAILTVARTIDLYHFRLAFDTVTLVGVSNAAAMVCWAFCSQKHPTAKSPAPWRSHPRRHDHHRDHNNKKQRLAQTIFSARHRLTYLFTIMFLALAIILCIRLNEWDEESSEPGKCYNSHLTLSPSATHPGPDKAYVSITAAWLISSMFSALFGAVKRRRVVLIVALMQFPVHLYMMIALRVANQELLEGTESENGWDFGQTTAVLLLGVTVNELATKAWGYYRWERGLRAGDLAGGNGDELSALGAAGDAEQLDGAQEAPRT